MTYTPKHRRARTPLWWLWFSNWLVPPSDPVARGLLRGDHRTTELVEGRNKP